MKFILRTEAFLQCPNVSDYTYFIQGKVSNPNKIIYPVNICFSMKSVITSGLRLTFVIFSITIINFVPKTGIFHVSGFSVVFFNLL